MKMSIRYSGEAACNAGVPLVENPEVLQSPAACRLARVCAGGNRVRQAYGNMREFRMFPSIVLEVFNIFLRE